MTAPLTLLIVEDETPLAEMHAEYIRHIPGFSQILLAGNLAQARMMIERFKPGLILLDNYLPDGRGINLLHELVQAHYPGDVVFTTAPTDAVLSVTNKDNAAQTPLADGRTYRLPKSGNPYSYSARAFGYADANGAYTVTGVDDAPNVTLDALARQTVTFGAVTAEDGKEIMPLITVTSKDWPSQTLTAESSGAYLLPNGEYSYTISCSGYKTVRGDFKVEDAAVAIPAVALAVFLAIVTNLKQTKKWHPIVFLGFSAVVGIVFHFAGA